MENYYFLFYNKIMLYKELQESITNIENTIGKDAAGAISAETGKIYTGFESLRKTIEEKDAKIAELTELKEKLVASNGDLLRQVRESSENENTPEPKEKEESDGVVDIDIKSAFAKNGGFIH